MPEDRELLLNAAAEGSKSELLTSYAKKVKAMERTRRRSEALRAAFEAENDGEKKKAIGQKLNASTASLLRYEKALAAMERKPEIVKIVQRMTEQWRNTEPEAAAQLLRTLKEENDELKSYLEYYKRQARATPEDQRRVDRADVARLARNLLKKYGSTADAQVVSGILEELGDTLLGDEIHYNDVRKMATAAAEEIANEVYEEDDTNADLMGRIKEYLRANPIKISDTLREDMPDLNYFRKKHMGTIRLENEGMGLDSMYKEMGVMYGEGLFPTDITASSDMLQQILDTLDALQPQTQYVYADKQLYREAVNAIANDIMDAMISSDVREERTTADRAMAQKLNAAISGKLEAEDALKAERRDRSTLVEQRARELRLAAEERMEKAQKRKNIAKTIKRLQKYLTTNSGKYHVPESMRGIIGELLTSIDSLSPRAGDKAKKEYLYRLSRLQTAISTHNAYLTGEKEGKAMSYTEPNSEK